MIDAIVVPDPFNRVSQQEYDAGLGHKADRALVGRVTEKKIGKDLPL